MTFNTNPQTMDDLIANQQFLLRELKVVRQAVEQLSRQQRPQPAKQSTPAKRGPGRPRKDKTGSEPSGD